MRISRKALVAGGLVATLAMGGIAFAYFSATGSGSGSASVGSSSGLDISQDGPAVTGLVPNGPAKTIHYTVTNNTAGAEFVDQVSTTVSSVTSGSLATEACDASMFTIVDGPALSTNLQPGHTASGTATIKLVDDGNNQDNCQGSTVSLAFASN